MGCDIHMFAEVRKSGKWGKVGKIFPYKYYDPKKDNRIDEDGFEWNPKLTDSPYQNRNYNLFAILADVRNSYGLIPISDPKGLPEDCSKELLMQEACVIGEDYDLDQLTEWVNDGYSEWIVKNESCTNPDGHSYSYFTVKELMDYDWCQFSMLKGCVDWEHWKECKEQNKDYESYSGSVLGGKVVNIGESDAENYLRIGLPFAYKDKSVYVNCQWTEKYAECAGDFLTKTIPALQALGNNEDVRIVFWFDN